MDNKKLHQTVIIDMSRNLEVFHNLLSGLSEEEYQWKQAPEKWCLLEVVCHLYDEEREDFRARVEHVLKNPDLPPTPFNPIAWVTERKYIEQDYAKKLENFLEERRQSIAWLKSLSSPNWDNTYHHPKFGPMSAKLFLSNWLAHDYLHIRQILKLKFDYLKVISGVGLDYAGDW